MNKLIACAMLGLGLTQSLVACSDDDDEGGNVAGAAGTSAGASSGGKNTGGSDQTGGMAGKGGSAGTAGTAGKGGSGGNGGTTNQGGDGAGGDPRTVGGEASVGGETSIGGETSLGGDGAGGAGGAPPDQPVQTPTPHWLSYYCDARASDTLGCEGSKPWHECYNQFVGFLSGEGGNLDSVCEGDSEENEFAKTFAMIAALEATAAACPNPDVDEWRCNLAGAPEPKDADCREAEEQRVSASLACSTGG